MRIGILLAAGLAVGLTVVLPGAIRGKDEGVEENTEGEIADETTPGPKVEPVATPVAAENEPGQPTPEEVCAAAAHVERLGPAFAGEATESRKEKFEASLQYAAERLAASSNPGQAANGRPRPVHRGTSFHRSSRFFRLPRLLRKSNEGSARDYLRAEAGRWLKAHGEVACVP